MEREASNLSTEIIRLCGIAEGRTLRCLMDLLPGYVGHASAPERPFTKRIDTLLELGILERDIEEGCQISYYAHGARL